MKKFVRFAAVVALLGLYTASFPAGAASDFRNKYASGSQIRPCGDDTVTYFGPEKLWPPNHKFQTTSVVADGDQGETVSLQLTMNLTEDAVGGDGGPNHDPDFEFNPSSGNDTEVSGTSAQQSGDANGDATVITRLRSERSGKGTGRTYTIGWTATFTEPDGDSRTCQSGTDASTTSDDPFIVTVPHDMRGGADWK